MKLGAFRRTTLTLVLAVLCAMSEPASAELPAVKLMTAPLVTPSAAWTYYGAGTTHTAGVAAWPTRPVELKEIARALGAGRYTADEYAATVYEYVRNNIAVDFRFGLSKGARGAVIDQSGTAFDQAHLMVELLREGGLTANYQVGTVSLTKQQFGQWSGVITNLNQGAQTFNVNAKAACQFLADGGIPATVNGAGSCTSLTGNLSSTGTPVVMGHVWVSANGKLYDPAFKKHLFKASVDLAAALGCGTAAAPTCGSTVLGLVPATQVLAGSVNYVQGSSSLQAVSAS